MEEHKLSKSLLWMLRYGIPRFVKDIQPGGYVDIDEIIALETLEGYTKEDIENAVASDERQLFEVKTDPMNGKLLIRATYGHAFPVDGLVLPLITDANDYVNVIFGTYWTNWESFKTTGIRKTKRNPIYLYPSIHGDKASSVSPNCEIFIFINLQQAISDGLKFYKAVSGVIIPDKEIATIDPKYFIKAIDAKTGEQLL